MVEVDFPREIQGVISDLVFPPPAAYDADIAALLSNEEAMTYLKAMSKTSTGGWSIDDARIRREKQEEEYNLRSSLNCAILWKGKFAGIGGFRDINWWNKCAEMGIILHPNYWKRRLSVEVHYLCLKFGFEVLGIHRVEFKTAASNIPMTRFLENILHASHEGTLRDFFPSGTEENCFENVAVYSVLSPEWPETKARLECKLQTSEITA
mmetsp:Transcript_21097/g.30490  ORF Transcript_21097/g.30490 Transcript_21097/m.30490 type:complete len:209 (-) Transcript_21097:127-753(-)